jgi:putative ABC transport system permease protein
VTAVIRAARGGIGRRKLQAVIIGVVLLAATATSVVALGLLANANGPFDRAFARQNGADVTAAVNPSVATQPQIAATTRLAGVTAAAGPYPGVLVTAQVTVPGVPGSSPDSLRVVGRPSPGGRVDDLTLDEGHWPDGGNQIVMDRGTGVFPGSTVTAGSQKLTVVGVADSVTGTADAWVLPSEVSALAGRGNPVQAQLLYRFASAGSTSAITADIAELRATLPRGALLNNPVSYLGARQSEQSNIAPWVPFIIAFGVIALVISVLIVINVVSGAVTAGTTRIGVLKSVGFTPAQVVASYVLLVVVPALAGCLAGGGRAWEPAGHTPARRERARLPGGRADRSVLDRCYGAAGRGGADRDWRRAVGAARGTDERGPGDRERAGAATVARLSCAPHAGADQLAAPDGHPRAGGPVRPPGADRDDRGGHPVRCGRGDVRRWGWRSRWAGW